MTGTKIKCGATGLPELRIWVSNQDPVSIPLPVPRCECSA
jgi:hypothetical protein